MKFTKVSKNRQFSASHYSNSLRASLDCWRGIKFCHSFLPSCVLSLMLLGLFVSTFLFLFPFNILGKFPTQITLNLGLPPVLLFRLFSLFRSHSRLNLGWRRHSRQAPGIFFQLTMCCALHHQPILESSNVLIPFPPFALQRPMACVGNGDGLFKFLCEDPIALSKNLHFRCMIRGGRGCIRVRLALSRR